MTTIAAASSASASATTPAKTPAKTDRQQIAGNFDQFLSLLTTQLKNQSPLEPLDTNQFTQQLVQFAQVEQQLKQNETLASLLTMNKSATAANAMSFVGARVTTDGASSTLKDGKAEWRLDAPRGGSAAITIKDKQGNVVATDTIALNAGQQTYKWNGRTSTGSTAPEGDYKIVVDAMDSQRSRIAVKTEVTGVVDGVDLSGDAPVLVIGGFRTSLDKVKSASRS
jgi:flagellar basal-body rod modification protein FlgD